MRAPSVILATWLVAACAATTSPAPSAPGGLASQQAPIGDAPSPTPPLGGTLRVGLPAEGDNGPITETHLDPHLWFGMDETFRCCLVRTLLSYNGRTTEDGGAILRPDLAESLPEVSSDGLTWTFRLRPGLRFGPPYEDTPITTRDIIRGIERSILLGEGEIFFEAIAGVAAVASGDATAVSGLEAPEERILVVRLDRPNADVATALSMPASAPIPAGAADGHDTDYGAFLVASGPYMWEGSEKLGKGGKGQRLDTGRSGPAVLVRNPAWDRATDHLRGAWLDRMELTRSRSAEDDRHRFDRGEIDLPGYPLSSGDLVEMRADAARRDRLAVATYPGLFFLPMNLALPPFDDPHVRRAVALGLDRAALVEVLTETSRRFTSYRVARHAIPDSFENNLLLDYDPFATPGDGGDVEAARAEMAESRYDADRDGRCDAAACREVPTVVGNADQRIVDTIEAGLAEVGISLRVRTDEADPYQARSRNGVFVLPAWLADTPTLGGFTAIFTAPLENPEGGAFSISASMLGSSPEQLSSWGYDVTSVPSMDGKVAECLAMVGSARFLCAAELDQLAVEGAIPLVPVAFPEVGFAFGERVVRYSIDQSVVAPALDQIAVGS